MNLLEKYLAVLDAAVEAKDKKAIELLDGFSAYVYQEIYAGCGDAPAEERDAWAGLLQRAKDVISGMSKLTPKIWD